MPANSWTSNGVIGPEIGDGTWIIFIEADTGANKWDVAGVSGTGCPIVYANTSHIGYVSTSGYYSGKGISLRANLCNGNAESRSFTVKFKAIKIADTYQE